MKKMVKLGPQSLQALKKETMDKAGITQTQCRTAINELIQENYIKKVGQMYEAV